MMAAYLISDVTVRDPGAFETYRTRAAAAIKAFDGITYALCHAA